jgi:hypothetical protein
MIVYKLLEKNSREEYLIIGLWKGVILTFSPGVKIFSSTSA